MFLNKFTWVVLLFFLLSCGKDKPNKATATSSLVALIDTNNAEQTYKNLKGKSSKTIDSAYISLTTVLTGRRDLDLLFKHLHYYDILDGHNKMSQALLARVQGTQYEIKSKFDLAQLSFEKSIELYKELNLPKELSKSYFMLATNYLYLGDNANALKHMYTALDIEERNHDTAKTYLIKTEMVTLYANQMDYDRAIKMALDNGAYYKARGNDEESRYLLAYNYANLGLVYHRTKEYKTAIEYGNYALNANRQLGNSDGVAHALNNIALSHVALEQYEQAIPLLEEAVSIQAKSEDTRQILSSKQNLAHCLALTGKVERATQMLQEVVTEANKRGQKQSAFSAYKELSSIYERQKDYYNALQYHQLYKKFSDSVYNTDNNKLIKELNVKYETHKKESQIQGLQAQKKLDSIKKTAYLVVLTLTIIISVLAILFFRNRNKKNKLLVERVQLELEANKKELGRFTDNIKAKNKFIEELEEKLATNGEQTQIPTDNNEQLSELYQFKILTEEDWRDFKILFDKVYPGLISRLRNEYPDLAPAEERQFLLTRLNIANKESADMLGISMQGIKKNRYRLKKRFTLSEQDNLDDFVKSF